MFGFGLGGILSGSGDKKQASKQRRLLQSAAAQIPGMDAFRSLEQPLAGRIGSRMGDFQFGDDTNRTVSDITGRATPFQFDFGRATPLQDALLQQGNEGLTDFKLNFDRARSRVREDALSTAVKEGRTGGSLQQGVTDAVGEFEERLIPMEEQIRQGRVDQSRGILSDIVNQLFRQQTGEEEITAGRLSEANRVTTGRDLATEQATVGRLTQALHALGLPLDAAIAKANILAGQQAGPNNMQIFGNAIQHSEDSAMKVLAAILGGGG